MAIRKASDVVAGLTGKIRLPRNRYTIRMIKEVFAPSKSDNPMVTRTWEIVNPETVEINGQKVLISGTEIIQWLPLVVLDEGERDKEKSDKAVARFIAENAKLDLPQEIDDEAPLAEKSGVGIVADAILSSEESVARLDPTPEQKAKREQGSPIKDGNGKDIINYRVKLDQILGLSSVDVT